MIMEEFNELGVPALKQKLMTCCHCEAWVDRVLDQMPFTSAGQLAEVCQQMWQQADEEEILEGFSGHPQIGDLDALRDKYANAEQGQITTADDATIIDLGERNAEYRDKFGFIFIVCATGKSAAEMLQLMEARIGNTRQTELESGAREQGAIMALRLAQLIEG